MRVATVGISLLFVIVLAVLTVLEIAKHGFGFLPFVSLLVLILLGIGLGGALNDSLRDND